MAKSILDLVIKLAKEGDADKQVVSGLTQVKAGVGEAMAVMGAFAAAGVVLDQVYQKTVVVFENYATQVRDMSRNTGMSAEESSKLIQASKQLDLNYDSLSKSLQEMQKRGQEPSIANLETMAAKYTALAPGVERAKYLTDNFGKSGEEMGKLLVLGADGVRKYTDAVNANLILSEKQLVEAQQLKQSQIQLNQVQEGAAITVGSRVVPSLSAWLLTMQRVIENGDKLRNILLTGIVPLTKEYGDAYNELQAQANGATNAVNGHTDALKGQTEAVKQLTVEEQAAIDTNKSVIDLTLQLQSSYDDHAKKVSEVRDKLAELNQEYNNGTIDEAEYQNKKKELTGELDKEAKSFEEASKRIVFSLLQQRLATEGMTDKNMKLLLSVGEGMGIIDSKTATVAKNINDNIGKLDTDKPEEFKKIMMDIFGLPDEKAQKITLENFDNPDVGPMADDLQAINDLPDEIKKTLNLTIITNGKIPDVTPPPNSQSQGETFRMGNFFGGAGETSSNVVVSSSSQPSAPRQVRSGESGGGTVIHIQNLHVTAEKGMTADDFVTMLQNGRG